MPELPEVETIRRQLAPLVEGRTLERLEILDPRWSRPLAPEELSAALEGRRVERLGRRGEYLLWGFSGDVHLAQHLRMTGAVLSDADPEPPHTRVRVRLAAVRSRGRGAGRAAGGRSTGRGAAGGVRRLAIVDPRRFGTGELLLGSDALDAFLAARLGLEPFDAGFTAEHLRCLLYTSPSPRD